MRRFSSRAAFVALAAALFTVPASVSAQVHLILGAGLSEPSGNLSNVVNSGYHGTVGLQIGVPLFPLSARVEGDVNRFPAVGGGSGNLTIADGTVSAVLSLGGVGISPYVLGGLGEYHTSYGSELGGGSATDVGYHAGVGLSAGLLGFGGFVEARFVSIHATGGDLRYFPITLGVRF